MNRFGRISTFLMIAAAVAVAGCKKQEAPQGAGSAPQQGNVKSISGQSASGATVTAPKDKADAEVAAKRVIDLMEAGDFATVYREATPGFQQIGPEAAFVAKFSQTRQKTGPFTKHQESSIVTLPDQTHVMIYKAENAQWKTERRITFARSKDGKMQLFGLNQHDEPKGAAAPAPAAPAAAKK